MIKFSEIEYTPSIVFKTNYFLVTLNKVSASFQSECVYIFRSGAEVVVGS